MLQRVHSNVNLLCVCAHVWVHRTNMRVRRSCCLLSAYFSLFNAELKWFQRILCVSVTQTGPASQPPSPALIGLLWQLRTPESYLSGASKRLFLCTKWAGQSEGPHPFCWCPLPEPESALWTHIHLKQPCFYSFGRNWPVLVSLPRGTGTKRVTECLRGKFIFLPPCTGLFVWLHMLNGAFFFSRLVSMPHISSICLQFE